jgi:hypothetical protein
MYWTARRVRCENFLESIVWSRSTNVKNGLTKSLCLAYLFLIREAYSAVVSDGAEF